MRGKLFAVVTAVGGSVAGGTLYLFTTNNYDSITTQTKSPIVNAVNQTSSSVASQEPRTVTKGKCQIITIPEEGEKFLNEQQKNKEDYFSVSCSNTNIEDSYIKLPLKWNGLFPKFVLNEQI